MHKETWNIGEQRSSETNGQDVGREIEQGMSRSGVEKEGGKGYGCPGSRAKCKGRRWQKRDEREEKKLG